MAGTIQATGSENDISELCFDHLGSLSYLMCFELFEELMQGYRTQIRRPPFRL